MNSRQEEGSEVLAGFFEVLFCGENFINFKRPHVAPFEIYNLFLLIIISLTLAAVQNLRP